MKKSKKVETRKKNAMSKDIIAKMKENDKIFEEKMSTLKQRKIKVVKPTNRKETRSQPKSKVKEPKKLTINKGERFNLDSKEPPILYVNKGERFNLDSKEPPTLYINKGERFNLDSKEPPTLYINKGDRFNFFHKKYFSKQNCIINIGQRLAIISKNQNYNFRNRFLAYEIDNDISLNYFPTKSKKYTEEEQDIYFITKIREQQNDIKYKTDLIIDLQNKLKHQDEEFIRATKREIEELNNKIKKISQEKDEKLREILRLETENYNQKRIIENFENKMESIKNNSEHEIKELKNKVKKISQEKDEKLREIQRLETDNYNQKRIIENFENKIKSIKDNSEIKKEEIEKLTSKIEQLRIENDEKKDDINRLQTLNKNHIKDYDLLKSSYNKLNNDKKYLERIIEDQKLKIEDKSKHINTLRKFIVEDMEGNKLNSKINENNKIISYNNKILNSRNKINLDNDDLIYNTINIENNINTLNNNEKVFNTINAVNSFSNNNDLFYKKLKALSFKSTPNINLLNKNKSINKKTNIPPPNNDSLYKNKSTKNMNFHNKNSKLNKSSNLENKKVKLNKIEEKVKQKEKKVTKNEKNDDDEYKKEKHNKYKKKIGNNNKNEDINDIDEGEDNENSDNDIEDDNEENEDEEEDDNSNDDDNDENINNSKKINDYNEKSIKNIKKNIIENMNNNKDTITSYQYTKKHHNRNNSDISDKVIRKAKIKYDSQNNFTEKAPRKNKKREKTISSLRKRINRDRNDDDDYNDQFYQTLNNFNEIKYMSNAPNFENELTYFPSEKYLVERKDEIATYEAELDLLLKEKNNLESEIIKMPEHPKTLREIKIKRALNERLNVNEKNINKVKRTLRLMKEA